MTLKRISVENYKCFESRQTMAIAPITVLLGKNNAGKSAIARSPLLISSGLRTHSPEPLDTSTLGTDGGSFEELIHGRSPHGSISFNLTFDGEFGESQLEVTVQNVDEYQMQVVSELAFRHEGQETLELVWDYTVSPQNSNRYEISLGGRPRGVRPIKFHGLLPHVAERNSEETDLDYLFFLLRRLRADLDDIRYLGPFREQPRRFYQMPSRLPGEIGSMGEFAPSALALDQRRTSGQLLDAVNSLLREGLPGWEVFIESTGAAFSLVLIPDWDPSQRINLVDTGTGIAQVLPIFIQRALDLTTREDQTALQTLEIVEQPELHLHPSAHAQLADLYINAAQTGLSRFIIETHSETLLLRLRRRVASGWINPDSVRVYYTDNSQGTTELIEIPIDENGAVSYWPEGVFSEDFAETRALAKEQLEKRDRRAR